MFETITQSEYMNAPSDDVSVLDSAHFFPCEFHMLFQSKTVQVDFGSSPKHVSLRAKCFSSALGPHFDGYSVDIVEFFVGEGNENFLKAIIFMPS